MQIAILVDTSATARDDIAYMREALPSFVEALTDGGLRVAIALPLAGRTASGAPR